MTPKKLHGITKAKDDGPFAHTGYQAQIKFQGKTISWPLRLKTPEEAARIWDVMAIYLRGPDARLNFDGRPPVGLCRYEIRNYLIDGGFISERYRNVEPKRFAALGVDDF